MTSHAIISTEGIVFRVIPFGDYDQIVSVFTPEAGVVKVMQKGQFVKGKKKKGGCMPLTKVELLYREKEGEIFSCHEMHSIDTFPSLRKSFNVLEAGCDLLQVVQSSQFVGKSAPALYALLCYYLNKISAMTHPELLLASFRLKVLKHDGWIALPFSCSTCGRLLQQEVFMQECEGYCLLHKPSGVVKWSAEELYIVYRLTESQSFQEIASLEISSSLHSKIIRFFNASFR